MLDKELWQKLMTFKGRQELHDKRNNSNKLDSLLITEKYQVFVIKDLN